MNSPPTQQPTSQPLLEVHLCIPEDQTRFLPRRRVAPGYLAPNLPIPRQGEVIYITKASAWAVEMVIHDWKTTEHLRVEVWLTHLNSSRQARPTGFSLTQ